MKLNYQFSVVIAVLNNVQQFSSLIKQLLSYQCSTMEIIVIDGGSVDGTVAVIKRYESNIAYWESGLDSGIGDAFNRGIQQARGDLVAILNSDDYWASDTLEHLLFAMNAQPEADIYYGDLQFIDEQRQQSYIKRPNLSAMKYRMNIFHPAMFVRRKAYQKIGLYRLDYYYAMDSEWCHRAIESGLTFSYIPHVLASMRLGGVSDRHFRASILEYKRSVIAHNLTNPFAAQMYFYFFLVMRYMMNNRLIWKLVRRLCK